MNSFVTFACLLAAAGVCHGSPYGYGPIITPVLAPAAVSTQNLVKAAPIPIVKTILTPVVSAPIIKSVPIVSGLGPIVSPLGLGINSLGLSPIGINSLGLSPIGINSLGLKGVGLGWDSKIL